MKSLIAICLFAVLSTSAFAKGVVSLKIKDDLDTKKEHTALALTVDEAVVGPLAYHSYSDLTDNQNGAGSRLMTSHQLDLSIKKVIVSPGVALKYATDDKKFDKEVFVKLGYQLW